MYCLRLLISGLGIFLISFNALATPDKIAWQHIKTQFYGDRVIVESNNIIELEAPYRAEDAALVPIKINSKINQSKNKYIKTITLFIDKNPVPFAASFNFNPIDGKADIAFRVRINTYSYVRAIAELSDGSLHMSKKFVKASGGCSAPIGADIDGAMKRLGKIKFRLDGGIKINRLTQAQLLISHPNITGMQMDQVTRFIRPAYFIKKVNVFFNDRPILTATTDIAISANPNFRFYFIPDIEGELRAEVIDTQGQKFKNHYSLN